ncbi:MAG: RNA polymerase sigma factor [Patescibacteria group bacterium]|nr:RNA polymerase sigma factor [Patescibacteria group bacterium]
MKNGDKRAAENLYHEIVDKVYGFCLSRVGKKVVAEDLTQDIFVKLVDKIGSFDKKRGNFLSWFWRLVRNALTDYYRSSGRNTIPFSRFPEESRIEEVAFYDNRVDLQGKIEFENVNNFVKTLSADEQDLFELRFIAELPYDEISKMIGKNEGTLRVAATRLKAKIKDNFQL